MTFPTEQTIQLDMTVPELMIEIKKLVEIGLPEGTEVKVRQLITMPDVLEIEVTAPVQRYSFAFRNGSVGTQ